MIKPKDDGKLISFGNISDSIYKYYDANGASQGLSTGWKTLDKYYMLSKGTLNIVTGIPSSGKSEFMDQLMLQTIAIHNWHWTVFSPENWPLPHHFQKLAEKWTGLPMFTGYNIHPMQREDIDVTIKDLGGSIHFLDPPQDNLTIDPIIKLLMQSKDQYNTDAFLLDPWNELEHHRPNNLSETEYIGATLTKIRNFARRSQIAIFIVAHPTKLHRNDDGNYPIPTPYDISGSSNWRNKADSCLTAWRDYQKDDGVFELHIQKMRNKNLGRMGMVSLHWLKANGLFFDYADEIKEQEKHGVKKIIVY